MDKERKFTLQKLKKKSTVRNLKTKTMLKNFIFLLKIVENWQTLVLANKN